MKNITVFFALLISCGMGCVSSKPDPVVEIVSAGSIINATSRGGPVSISLDEVDLKDVVRMSMPPFASFSGRQSLTNRTLSASLDNVPVNRVLIAVLEENGLCLCSTKSDHEFIIITKEEARTKGLTPLKKIGD